MAELKRVYTDGDAGEEEGGGAKRFRGGGGGGGGGGAEDLEGEAMRIDDELAFEAELLEDAELQAEQAMLDQAEADAAAAAAEAEAQSTQAARWRRPDVASDFSPSTSDLAFQWTAIDMATGSALKVHPRGSGHTVPGSRNAPVPIVRLYGVSESGNSVSCFVHGFTPYLFCILPRSCTPGAGFDGAVLNSLNRIMAGRGRTNEEKKCATPVLGVSVHTNKQSIMGYQFDEARVFLQIYVAMPTMIPGLKRLLEEEGIDLPGVGLSTCPTYESNVPFILRFMIDNAISGSNWLELKAATYVMRSPQTTTSQIEVDVIFEDIVSHPSEGRWSKLAPLRILSFDIECQGRKGHFPEPDQDPVIQISNVVAVQGEEQPIIQNVFTLGGCLPIVGAHVIPSAKEEDLLLKWRDFVQEADADIITGYNVQNFDIPYLMRRSEVLKRKCSALKRFAELGRIRGVAAKMRDTSFQSAQYGNRENIETTIDGRVMFDLLPYMFRNHKLSSYSLNSVSAEFLGQQKEDVHHSIIADLQNGSDADRHRLAVYCLKDSLLPIRLMAKLSVLVNYVEMARVTGVPVDFLLARGQQIKVFSMLLRKCRAINLLIPNLAKFNGDDQTYEGATVIEPKKAFYNEPIATLDFASLYPSIIQAYNLCYSTLVAPQDLARLSPDQYEQSPCGDVFVNHTTRKGILPQILDELLAARKRAKKDMKAATDPMEYAVQNGRQLALKVSANSVYGFTGATVGQLPCLPIASSTTSYGRTLLERTKAYVESHYTVEKGFSANAEVVYGDTDSVMIKFGAATVAETMPLAERAAEEISQIFPRPILLEFEKVYWPYLLMNKKRYAGLLWTSPDKYDKMDAKGLETVRRDNCLLVRQMIETCLRKILIDRDVQAAISHAKGTISDLLQNKIDISLLVITKSLAKSADDEGYKAKQAHVELAMRMRKRDPGSAPSMGDRVPYVFIQGAKGTPAYEKSEDPVYVLDNNLPIDVEYYLHNQLSKPLQRIFEPIIDNTETLLSGDHTRVIRKPTPTARKGGIMMFAVKTLKCLGCKTPISDEERTFCLNCRPREPEIFMQKVAQVADLEQSFSRLWTECQRCQGSMHHDVLCSNCDCPIFYKRKKIQKDLQDTQESLDRFQW